MSYEHLPPGFVYLSEWAPTVQQDIRYAGSNNFVGRPIDGYQRPCCILSRLAAEKITVIQRQLSEQGMALRIFDGYRPQQAVAHFVRWSQDPHDQVNKAQYYPNVMKEQLFAKGYIAEKSSHTRGSTVDLTVVSTCRQTSRQLVPGPIKDDGELDMGTPFDWFGIESHTDNTDLSAEVQANRSWFKEIMAKQGFYGVLEEWWHFTLINEPFPDTYFDFPVR